MNVEIFLTLWKIVRNIFLEKVFKQRDRGERSGLKFSPLLSPISLCLNTFFRKILRTIFQRVRKISTYNFSKSQKNFYIQFLESSEKKKKIESFLQREKPWKIRPTPTLEQDLFFLLCCFVRIKRKAHPFVSIVLEDVPEGRGVESLNSFKPILNHKAWKVLESLGLFWWTRY